MNPSRVEIRLTQGCGDNELLQIRDIIREKALRPPGNTGLVFIVPTPEAEVLIDTQVRRLNHSPDLIAALQTHPAVASATFVGETSLAA